MKSAKLLDASALIKLFNEEPGAHLVEAILNEGRAGHSLLYLSEINAGEIYYCIARKNGQKKAEEILGLMRTLSIQWISIDFDRVISAARLKAKYPLSYADCFALACAMEHNAELVTADPEFKSVAGLVKIRWV